jgi:hypothetical protein
MSFPDFEVSDNFPQSHNDHDGIQVENMGQQDQGFDFNMQSQATNNTFYAMPNNPEGHWGNNAELFAVVVEIFNTRTKRKRNASKRGNKKRMRGDRK